MVFPMELVFFSTSKQKQTSYIPFVSLMGSTCDKQCNHIPTSTHNYHLNTKELIFSTSNQIHKFFFSFSFLKETFSLMSSMIHDLIIKFGRMIKEKRDNYLSDVYICNEIHYGEQRIALNYSCNENVKTLAHFQTLSQ